MRRPALGLAKFVAECAGGGAKFVAECAGGGGIEPLGGGCGAAEDVNRPPFVLNVGADAAALSRAAAARKAVVCAAEPSLAVRRGKWKFVWETGALDVRCGQPLNRSPNLGAVTGVVAGAAVAAAAAGAGERCVVAMFTSRRS